MRLAADFVGAGSPANIGTAGAIHRGACFAGKPAPTECVSHSRSRLFSSVRFGSVAASLRLADTDLERTAIQSSVVSAGLIAGKPAPTGISSAIRHALYLWEPRLPAMGREAAPVTDARYGSIAVTRRKLHLG
ncbi:Sensory box protein/GGDEF family protein (modular protein) [Pseudomonas sp. JV551A1]|uniref:Sensory box protein/GGDEF family protein (Modular protein) n=1 Tax=Pseudomonas inefficax TaxID=2078786 RepID=A0AAQ1SUY6_9PSED|nr:Sensory box protein/GGDEF family protein (modular protein) [Pseudomonas sp. JV551A1]SPO61722.1 Sensory box protein/GGDEF family protein (modular protein) [Pseudomonas inefficax]